MTQDFEEFWKNYPKKKGHKEAKAWWLKNKPSEELQDIMRKALMNQICEKEFLRKNHIFCPEWPDGNRWFKHGRWEDSLDGRFLDYLKKQRRQVYEKKIEEENRKQKIREEYGEFYRGKTKEELQAMKSWPKCFPHIYLIDEILQER
jgi:hypothetical protein